MDKGLVSWTRAWRDGQGLVEMDKGEATQGHSRSDKGFLTKDKGLASGVKDLANRRTLAREKK